MKADYLLLEIGMGGTLRLPPMWSTTRSGVVITPVDFDHQNFLGNTVAEIAGEKAGILKRGATAVIGRQRDEGRAC